MLCPWTDVERRDILSVSEPWMRELWERNWVPLGLAWLRVRAAILVQTLTLPDFEDFEVDLTTLGQMSRMTTSTSEMYISLLGSLLFQRRDSSPPPPHPTAKPASPSCPGPCPWDSTKVLFTLVQGAGLGKGLEYSCYSVTSWTAAHQASLSFTISQSLLKLMTVESVMPSNHLILCHPLLFLPYIFPSIRVFPSELTLDIRWPEYWSFSFSNSPSNEY